MSRDDGLDPEQLARRSADYTRSVVELLPGEELRVDSARWRDALVFVTAGEIELRCESGQRRCFARGAILCLMPTVRLIRNGGDAPARLIAVARRRSG